MRCQLIGFNPLSVNTFGHCIHIYEKPGCKGWHARVSPNDDSWHSDLRKNGLNRFASFQSCSLHEAVYPAV